jgi:hypothetical protein
MSEVTARVRPRAQYLRQLPTLARQTAEQAPTEQQELARRAGIDFVLELKLQTPEARWWLCTQGAAEARPGVPRGWIVDYITPEYPDNNGGWRADDSAAYGPQNTAWLQGNDYLQMLTDECDRIRAVHEKHFTWKTAQQLDVTQEEIRQVVAAMDRILDRNEMGRLLPLEPPAAAEKPKEGAPVPGRTK